MPRKFSTYSANPFRPPNWRFEHVVDMVDADPPRRTTKGDDEWIKGFRHFLLRYNQGDDLVKHKLFREDPDLYTAMQIYEERVDNPEVALLMEARALARLDPDDIAALGGTAPGVIEWYERLWFDVRPKHSARDWITKHVLLKAFAEFRAEQIDNTNPPVIRNYLDASLKFFAYFGGEHILEHMISGFRTGDIPKSADEVDDWYDRHFKTAARRVSSMAIGGVEVNKYNVMDLFAVHGKIMDLKIAAQDDDATGTSYERNVAGIINEISFAVGSRGVDVSNAAELRASEALQHALGVADEATIQQAQTLTMPPPREKAQVKGS